MDGVLVGIEILSQKPVLLVTTRLHYCVPRDARFHPSSQFQREEPLFVHILPA